MTETQFRAGFPVLGAVFSIGCAGLMAAVSWAAWPDLPEVVRTGTRGTGPTFAPRWLFTGVMPATVLFLAVLLSVLPALGARWQRWLELPGALTPHGTARAMDTVLVLLSVFLLTVHATVVLDAAGREVPVERITGVSVGALFAAVGLLLARAEPAASPENALVSWWRGARWPVGTAVAGYGAAVAVAGLLVPHPVVVVTCALLLVPAIVTGIVVHHLRTRRG